MYYLWLMNRIQLRFGCRIRSYHRLNMCDTRNAGVGEVFSGGLGLAGPLMGCICLRRTHAIFILIFGHLFCGHFSNEGAGVQK